MPTALPLGIYEKALPLDIDWYERLDLARQVGFDFVELSCDESAERQARLDWTKSERRRLRDAVDKSGVPLMTLCLSAHRALALGSAHPGTRRKGLDLMQKAIDFSLDLGVRIIQIAGYYDYYGASDSGSERRYLESLEQGIPWASEAGLMLGVETMEGANVVDSISRALRHVEALNSPWFQIYPDIGNLAAHGFDLGQRTGNRKWPHRRRPRQRRAAGRAAARAIWRGGRAICRRLSQIGAARFSRAGADRNVE